MLIGLQDSESGTWLVAPLRQTALKLNAMIFIHNHCALTFLSHLGDDYNGTGA